MPSFRTLSLTTVSATVTAATAITVATSAVCAAPLLPHGVHTYLDRVRPELADAIAADGKLLREVGARGVKDLEAATYDYDRELRFYSVDSRRLARAEQLADALVATDRYCMPYCVAGACKALMCFQYDPRIGTPTLLSVGRSEQAARLQDGMQRIKASGIAHDGTHRVVLAGTHELFLVGDEDEQWLVPATAAQADAMAAAAGGRRMDRVSLAELRALVEADVLALDEIQRDDDAGYERGAAAEEAAPAEPAAAAPTAAAVPTAASEIEPVLRVAEAAAVEDVVAEGNGSSHDWSSGSGEPLATRRLQQAIFLATGFALLAIRLRKRRLSLRS